jgi:hypothetical protein
MGTVLSGKNCGKKYVLVTKPHVGKDFNYNMINWQPVCLSKDFGGGSLIHGYLMNALGLSGFRNFISKRRVCTQE